LIHFSQELIEKDNWKNNHKLHVRLKE